ncbi:MAG: ATP-binding protein [Nitrospinaceae bacterium]|nr:ATP-binding protein [Nitrospinaceae bacterium]
MNTENIPSNSPSPEISLKTLWGASRWPGSARSSVVVQRQSGDQTLRRLRQMLAVHTCGLLYGPHGVGKSFLIHCLTQSLSPKEYRVIRLTHSSLMGGDLMRQLLNQAGKTPLFRRGDNVRQLQNLWEEWHPVWPVLIIEEAQDLNAPALEELRLLTCARTDTQNPFSLILIGDPQLPPRLEMGVNRALLSRMGFSLKLEPWDKPSLTHYLDQRFQEVGIHTCPLEPPAQELLLQSAKGIPRTLNSLLQRAMELAAEKQCAQITIQDVQSALDTMPWVAGSCS